jgi:hypothetical protein
LRVAGERILVAGRFAKGLRRWPTMNTARPVRFPTSITDSIAAQRRSIEALQTQLSLFDEQLAVMEDILGPLAQWSRTWADLEQQLLNLRGARGTGEPPLTLVDPCHIGSPSQSARIFITSTGKLVSIPIFRSADAARSLVRKRPDADDPGPGADRWLLLALMA